MKYKSKKISNARSIELIDQYQKNNDLEARNEVLLGNIGLVYKIAHRFRRSIKNHFDDFVSEGVIGMIEAINRFDTKKYHNFSTYACYYILNRVSASVNMGTLNLPQHRIQIYQNYEKEKINMLSRGETPSLDIIAEKMGISVSVLSDTINKKDDISLDFTSSSDPHLSMRNVSSSRNFEEEMMTKIDFEKTKMLIQSILTEQEKDIINYRFGLDDEDPQTLQEISDHMNISTEYVRVLQNKSLLKLRRALSRRW